MRGIGVLQPGDVPFAGLERDDPDTQLALRRRQALRPEQAAQLRIELEQRARGVVIGPARVRHGDAPHRTTADSETARQVAVRRLTVEKTSDAHGKGRRFVRVDPEPVPDRSLDAPARVIGLAASAGGVEALRCVVSDLPADLPAAICVVLHIPATGRSLLAPILDRNSALEAVVAQDGQRLRAGVIYVAPADRHLLVRRHTIELSHGPKENGVRPAADPMFRSLARAWGSGAIGGDPVGRAGRRLVGRRVGRRRRRRGDRAGPGDGDRAGDAGQRDRGDAPGLHRAARRDRRAAAGLARGLHRPERRDDRPDRRPAPSSRVGRARAAGAPELLRRFGPPRGADRIGDAAR